MNTCNQFCLYYVGQVKKEKVWMLSSALRGTEHIAFDRTIDVTQSLFEFFVPVSMESIFLELMDYLRCEGVLLSLEKKENRLLADGSFV